MDYGMKRASLVLAACCLLLPAVSALGQTVTTTVTAGGVPHNVAVNPVTNTIYVANSNSNNVTVIAGAANTTTTVTDPNASSPCALAVNPVTNKIYVANYNSGNVTVIDGSNGTVITTVAAGSAPCSVAVNTVTNQIYVANNNSNDVTVIDGATNTPTTVADENATEPYAIALNPVTNTIYVANHESNNVTVIYGATNTTTTVADENASAPAAVAVDQATNQIYVANQLSNNVTVIDGASLSVVATLPAGTNPGTVAVNPANDQIYVANKGSNNVTVIDGLTNTATTVTDRNASEPQGLAVNPVTNTIYVTNQGSDNVTVIAGSTGATTTVADPKASQPWALAVNPVTDKVYVANLASNNVSVFDGAKDAVTSLAAGTNPQAVALNSPTNTIYVTNYGSNNVTVINGLTDEATVAAGTNPTAVAVNPVTDQIFVANLSSNNVTVIDAANENGTTTITDPNATAPYAIAVNPVTNMIYVANSTSNNVTVIEGATGTVIATLPAGTHPSAVAVNPATNQIYVANNGSNSVTVIDGATNLTSTVAVGSSPSAVAVNSVTNQIYVANSGETSNNVTVIDGVTAATSTVTDSHASQPGALAVNPLTNLIYVANGLSGNVTVIAGATSALSASYYATISAGNGPHALAVNAVSNKIYVANQLDNSVTVIDGPTGTTRTVKDSTAAAPYAVAVNPATNDIYIANSSSNTVTAIAEQQVLTNPIVTGITTLAGNDTPSLTPTFGFEATNSGTTIIDDLLFQVDTWQGAWSAATPTECGSCEGPSSPEIKRGLAPQTAAGPLAFTGTTAALQPGLRTLFAYSTDGEETSSTNTGVQNSPLIGNIAAYNFLVAAPEAFISPNSLTFSSQVVGTTSASQTVTLTNNGLAPLTVASVTTLTAAGSNSTEFAESDNCVSSRSIPPAGTCAINVTFTPAAAGSRTATLQVTDNSGYITGNQHTVNLTGTGAAPGVSVSPTTLTFSSQAVGTSSPSQPVTLTNSGSEALSISGITTSGDFSQTNNCGNSLAAGSACTINVTFTPTAVGARTASLVITDNSGGESGSQQTINLTGTAVQATTSTELAGTTPCCFGLSTTFAATVVPQGTGTPTGSVTFDDGTVPLSCTPNPVTLPSSDQAACAVSSLAVGPHSITAVYSGDSNFQGSTSSALTFTVSKAPTTTVITANTPKASALGQAVSVSFTVAVNAPASGTIPGTDTVTVTDTTGASCSATVAAGSCSLTPKAAGADTLTATYSGDANFSASTSAGVAQSVGTAATTTKITANTPNPSVLGQSVSVSFTVAVNPPGSGTIPGSETVTVADTTGASCSATVAAGNCSLTPKAVGADTLTATYSGDASFSASSSAGVAQSVSMAATTSKITANTPNPSALGQSVSVSFTVAVNPPGSGTIPGSDTVTVADTTGASCSGTVAAGSCSLTPKAAGADTLTATYGGDTSFRGSTSAGVAQTVNTVAATTTKITSNTPNPSVLGQSVAVSFTVAVNPPASGTIPGTDTVTVTDTTGASCSGTVAAGNCSLTPKAAGADTLTATYSGDANFSASTSAGVAQTVNTAATTTTKITANTPNPSTLGQSVSVSFTVAVNPPASGTIPGTDTVTVTDTTGASCSATVAAGSCSLTPKAAGADTLTATYNGDSNFQGSASQPVAQTVNLAAPSLTSITPNSGAQGASVNVTLAGANFVVGATQISDSNPGVTVSNQSVVSATQMTATFAIAAAASPGATNATVTTAGGASNAVAFTIVTAGLSGVSVTGFSGQPSSTGQYPVAVSLSSPAAAQVTGMLSLSFSPASTVKDWNSNYTNAQFAAGCGNATAGEPPPNPCTATFTVAQNASSASLPVQVGTVAGTITVTLTQLSANGSSVLPSPPPSTSVTVAPAPPAITAGSVVIIPTATGFNVQLDAASNTRDLQSATFNFAGTGLTGTTLFPDLALETAASSYFAATSSLPNGGGFQLTVPFTYSGAASVLDGTTVTVTLENSAGTSAQVSGGTSP